MRVYDLIVKKRDGDILSKPEIDFLISGFTSGEIPDYQISAFLMAAFIRGLNQEETAQLTMAMVHSGEQLDLSGIIGKKVDKHSTGGVGDKTTLILGPMAAAAGVKVAKLSGRGLGHTGGTLDKLESIPGFDTNIAGDDFIRGVNRIGIVVAGQTANIVPADKKLYALRDVTGTVENISLIAASIMSKKIASGADAIVLDVKTGSGAFMKTTEDAIRLAQSMVDIGVRVGRRTVAVVTGNDQPLGNAIGNALEVREAIQTLQGNGSADLVELCTVLTGQMIYLAELCANQEQGKLLATQTLQNGSALKKLREMICNQGGEVSVVDDPSIFATAKQTRELLAPESGYILAIDAEKLGVAALLAGAGRQRKEDSIDYGAGIVLHAKVGDKVHKGMPIATLHIGENANPEEVQTRAATAYSFGDISPAKLPLVRALVTESNVVRYDLI